MLGKYRNFIRFSKYIIYEQTIGESTSAKESSRFARREKSSSRRSRVLKYVPSKNVYCVIDLKNMLAFLGLPSM